MKEPVGVQSIVIITIIRTLLCEFMFKSSRQCQHPEGAQVSANLGQAFENL